LEVKGIESRWQYYSQLSVHANMISAYLLMISKMMMKNRGRRQYLVKPCSCSYCMQIHSPPKVMNRQKFIVKRESGALRHDYGTEMFR